MMAGIGDGQRARRGKLLQQSHQELRRRQSQLKIEVCAENLSDQREKRVIRGVQKKIVTELVDIVEVNIGTSGNIAVEVDTKNQKDDPVAEVVDLETRNPKIKRENKQNYSLTLTTENKI